MGEERTVCPQVESIHGGNDNERRETVYDGLDDSVIVYFEGQV